VTGRLVPWARSRIEWRWPQCSTLDRCKSSGRRSSYHPQSFPAPDFQPRLRLVIQDGSPWQVRAHHACSSVQNLPLAILELVLGSDHLILASENDTFALIMAWADGRPETEWSAMFHRLLPCLRLHHMSPIFVASVVARTKYPSDLKPLPLVDAMAYQSIATNLSLHGPSLPGTSLLKTYKSSRASEDPTAYLFGAEVGLADCLALENDKWHLLRRGVAEGYRLTVGISNRSTVRLAVFLEGFCGESGTGDLGPITRLKVRAGGVEGRFTRLFPVGTMTVWNDYFGKPWGEVVCQGSPYFSRGRMAISVTIQFLKHPDEAMIEELP
jgi:hypothetical protein